MTALLEEAARQLEQRADPPFLSLIRGWRDSSCLFPDRYPPAELAPNWQGPGSLCGSCSTCRPEQRAPLGDWSDWLYLAGRGAGKTRSAAEYIAEAVATNHRWRVAILAPTYQDARDTCVEGESGLLAVFDRWGWTQGTEYVWNRSLGEIRIRSTRSRIKLFSGEKPARLRGPQHHLAWVEELAQVVKDAPDAWDMLKFGLRLGKHPRTVSTTTPLPVQVIRDLLVDPHCAVTRGKTDDNRANLPEVTLRELHRKYDGTRLARQELDGEMLDDIPGALWRRPWFDEERIPVSVTANWAEDPPARTQGTARTIVAELAERGIRLSRIAVALDPAVTSGEDADLSGIVVVGRASNGRFYVLADYTIRDTPDVVMAQIIQAYDDWEANFVVVEVNNGGEYIPAMLTNTCQLAGHPLIPVEPVRAKKGKRVRAEPVSALYAQRRVIHVGDHRHLEDQLCVWLPEQVESPDRMDALVYGVLLLDGQGSGGTISTTSGRLPAIQRHRGRRTTAATTTRRPGPRAHVPTAA